jgi:hypothetical protein
MIMNTIAQLHKKITPQQMKSTFAVTMIMALILSLTATSQLFISISKADNMINGDSARLVTYFSAPLMPQ